MAGAVSALFLLDIKGRVLIWRDYRGDVSSLQAERFFTKLIEKVLLFLNFFLGVDLWQFCSICKLSLLIDLVGC